MEMGRLVCMIRSYTLKILNSKHLIIQEFTVLYKWLETVRFPEDLLIYKIELFKSELKEAAGSKKWKRRVV
jgi:hypothetical protein